MTQGDTVGAALPGLCLDCASDPGAGARCRSCGSPRLVRHAELNELSVAHLDCDAFYAAIEKRDDPSLADRPLIIGGGRRGVVSTACYIARIRGVRSAMPMFQAMKLCPDAVVLPPDMRKYAEVGRQIRAMMLELTPLVEPLSIDEAFMDLSGTQSLHRAPPARTLARLILRLDREVGISASIGLAPNKFLAKMASDLDKPRGFSVVGRAEARSFLAARPVSAIWGVGPSLHNRLLADGLRTIADLQRADRGDLARRYGANGLAPR
ncbi:DNA polymerase IV [Lutibaculum baratangense AMV1]|uniref:DNA-directed DNA polymerase n=1 Tax=Lutibaculum baratangense AMV1 TaxID=631454 RepID=V4TAZ1_9HYPH|nr:DNA polymerase IV [Lutibaculum baratangense AMV1]